MLARTRRPGSPHDTMTDDAFGGPTFCAGCHQFEFPLLRDEGTPAEAVVGYSKHPMQNTVAQHAAGPYAKIPCLNCHGESPGGHTFPGGHSAAMLERAVAVETCMADRELAVTIRNRGAGHNIPTGDLHRHLVLRVWRPSAPEGLHETSFGRRFAPAPDGGKLTVSDTTIPAGDSRRVVINPNKLGPNRLGPNKLGPNKLGATSAEALRLELRLVYTIDEFPFRGHELDAPTFSTIVSTTLAPERLQPCATTAATAAAKPEPPPIPAHSQQLILVTTPDWNASKGVMTTWTRTSHGPWRQEGQAFPVVVGEAGLGWGRGLHAATVAREIVGPTKREGDGRGPAGVFTLGAAFGYADSAPTGVRWPYVASPKRGVCVDDVQSPLYNQLTQAPPAKAPWRSAEPMRLRDIDYRWGLFVEHNRAPVEPAAGSCIFIHIASPPDVPTSGCTALTEAQIEALLRWLNPNGHPVLVQLPESALRLLRTKWDLPPELPR